MKQIACGDVVPGCAHVIRAKDEQELMKQAADHAKKAHGLATIPPEVAKKVKAAIKDV